jgi:2,3-bisphosphoglycerate-independent phosphoglycerate mutase
MKYVVILGDGMADHPQEKLGGKTPIEVAKTPNMDYLAQNGEVGTTRTIPEGMPTGSDTANLSVFGYYPRDCYSGRSPLEAVSMGIDLEEDDVTFRCNLVTITDTGAYENETMVDYSSGEITTEEAGELIRYLKEAFQQEKRILYPGISYRHCLVLKNAVTGTECTPPHDITGKPVKGHLPKGVYGDLLLDMMKRSRDLLRDHPVNQARIKRGLNPANSCWFWGEGTKPKLQSFEKLYGVKGAVISAVDLIKGIGICAGLKSVDVPGATGNYDTNFAGKAQEAIRLLKSGYDFVYLHMEAPDECGHHGDAKHKIESIESIDREVVGPLLKAFAGEPLSILLMPDHPTPLEVMTHTGEPVPFVLYRSNVQAEHTAPAYSEKLAAASGVYVPRACELMGRLLSEK